MIETRFKDTEIGRIPEDWGNTLVGSFAKVTTGGTPNTSEPSYWDGNIPWMNSGELNLKIVKTVEGRITESGLKYSSTKWIPAECVLIGLAGQGKTRGTAAYNTIPLCINQSIGAIHPSDVVDNKFLYYYMNTQYTYLRKISDGGGGRGGLTKSLLERIEIPIPPKPEQTRIATALSKVDALISELSKLIEKKRAIKQGAMQQLLTGKKRLKGFSEPWAEMPLKDICTFQNGYTPSKAINRFWENGTIPWFRMEDIRTNGRILADSIQHITEDAVKGSLFPAGSIIMSTTATIGEHALLIVDSLANQQFTNLIIRKSLTQAVDTMWFYHYCFVLGEWCRNNINEGGLAAVNMEDFSNVIIPLPSFDEQKAIASVLSSMDDEISALEVKRNKYTAIKQGMMQQLLTGKIRLTD